uniref:Uncharacterized protein n=1 Tax=Globisporangium ultimum (strain ATCC 200006 / CBS 805.95 / DAOM BR144) TaxID=431595 RepID=K3WD04_GLOUD
MLWQQQTLVTEFDEQAIITQASAHTSVSHCF